MDRRLVERADDDGRLPGVEPWLNTPWNDRDFASIRLRSARIQGHFVFSDAFSDEKRHTMHAYGAEITDVRSDDRQITEHLIKTMIATAGEMSHRPGHWWCDQLSNRDGEVGYEALGEKL